MLEIGIRYKREVDKTGSVRSPEKGVDIIFEKKGDGKDQNWGGNGDYTDVKELETKRGGNILKPNKTHRELLA